MLVQMAPLVLIFVVFYFLLIRPQQKKMKEHKAKIDAVKKGDQVVTGGGLVGKVVRVDEFYADVDLAPGMKVTARSDKRRVGNECVRTCRSRRWPYHTKKNTL